MERLNSEIIQDQETTDKPIFDDMHFGTVCWSFELNTNTNQLKLDKFALIQNSLICSDTKQKLKLFFFYKKEIYLALIPS